MNRPIALLTLALLTPGLAHAQTRPAATATASRTEYKGNARFGTATRRSVVASHAGANARFGCTSSFNARIAGREYRAVEVSREAQGQSLGSRNQRGIDRSRLTLLGQNNFTIGLGFSKSLNVASFQTPVFVGPFVLTLRGSVGLTFAVRGFVGPQADGVLVGRDGWVAIGGVLGLGMGPPGAQLGVEGALDLVKASLPATCTMRRAGLTFKVSLVLESSFEVRLFAELGVGWFKKKWTVDVPFMKYTFARRELPITHRTLSW